MSHEPKNTTEPMRYDCTTLEGIESALAGAVATAATASTKEDTDAEDQIEVSAADRNSAHRALDRWLDECQREGPARFEGGQSGYIGRIKLCAFVDDNGISLRIERSISEEL